MNDKYRFNSILIPVATIVLTLLALVLAFTNTFTALRAPMAFLFLMFLPGLAFVRLLRLGEPAVEIVLTVALSLAIDMVVSLILLYLHLWSFETIMMIIAGITILGSILPPGIAVRRAVEYEGGKE